VTEKMKNEDVELILPLKPEYVGVARLTASAIASRMGFDVENIEDIKVSISEVCNKLVTANKSPDINYSIVYKIFTDKLIIAFKCCDSSLKTNFTESDDNGIHGILIISALMDEVKLHDDGDYLLSMSKYIREIM